jgi:membrane associated rhomboid family serine protease
MPPNDPLWAAASPNPSTSSWFAGATTTKLLVILSVVAYGTMHTQKTFPAWQFDAQLIRDGQWHRLFSSKVAFGTPGTAILGTTLGVLFSRQFERELGSRRFVSFVLFVQIVAVLLEAGLLATAFPYRWRYSGPYALLGAAFRLYHVHTPRLHPRFFGVLGFWCSEKAVYYLWMLQLTGSGGYSTVGATATGWLAAVLYTRLGSTSSSGIAHLPSVLDIPDWLVALWKPIGDRVGDVPPRLLVPRTAAAGRPGFAPAPHPIFGGQPLPPPAPTVRTPVVVEPDPAAREQLLLMGFDADAVEQALRETRNDVNRAADRLLNQ